MKYNNDLKQDMGVDEQEASSMKDPAAAAAAAHRFARGEKHGMDGVVHPSLEAPSHLKSLPRSHERNARKGTQRDVAQTCEKG